MKTTVRFISGIAASLLLAAGLHAAAGKLDPMTNDASLQTPDVTTADNSTIAGPPCLPCEIDQ